MSLLNVFRIVALLEGISYILLLFIATPLKHFGNDPTYVRLLGMPHGLLFVAYIALAILLKPEQQWNKRTFLIILAASLIPFGTFYVDKKFLAPKK
ncbi:MULTISPECIES: DUF3817 domain-containing protein [Mesoflavibacter]|uniref:DUF3817 domain-containing protein n=1 Tax=Mesoflavibacter profundi TaxID=2708110 RepID=A0ABT4RXR6_9FLAO|nr:MULTISPECIES: DUF3817 domain-containing protein [Mesoflavibacter]MDA0176610.1 DUF3817 domain-containing protein [Mesoflavibacter profundi]QIJ90267.1 hypothetical protein C7H62_2459 [Mesoflavibacter sp. HG96]QIJ92995.1 hypothetical protein C7H56_2459 [Mesoflavibacter sp. HG37]